MRRDAKPQLWAANRSATMSHAPRALSPAKAERLRRKAEHARREKRRFVAQLCGIGTVVADYLFMQWARYKVDRNEALLARVGCRGFR